MQSILPLAKKLLKEVDYDRKPIRLIGLSVSNPKEEHPTTNDHQHWEQLSFDFKDWDY
jgi:DNA polymerase-4